MSLTLAEKKERAKKIIFHKPDDPISNLLGSKNYDETPYGKRTKLSVINNLNNFPTDDRFPEDDARIINYSINDDGSYELFGIIKDGTENDPKTQKLYNISSGSDQDQADLEADQFKRGILKEVANRTLSIHQTRDYWENMESEINAGNIITGDW